MQIWTRKSLTFQAISTVGNDQNKLFLWRRGKPCALAMNSPDYKMRMSKAKLLYEVRKEISGWGVRATDFVHS